MKKYAIIVYWSDEDAIWIAEALGPGTVRGARQYAGTGGGGIACRDGPLAAGRSREGTTYSDARYQPHIEAAE